MALGDDGDFRMVGFRQVMRFPPQDVLGGTGSILGRDFTTPFGGNIQQPGSWSTNNYYNNNNFNQYTNNNIFNNNITNNYNNYNDCSLCGGGGGGGTISVVDSLTSTTYSNISTLNFSGSAFASVVESPTGTAIITNNDTGGGGGGSTLEYGEIISSTKLVATEAIWSYDIEIWQNGAPTGTTVTAYNTLERGNTSTLAYGYTVSSADGQSIPGTVYKVQPVPTGAFVVMEDTDAFSLAGTDYWFSAPNRIDGTCT
jgi:hypothetical protein